MLFYGLAVMFLSGMISTLKGIKSFEMFTDVDSIYLFILRVITDLLSEKKNTVYMLSLFWSPIQIFVSHRPVCYLERLNPNSHNSGCLFQT